MDTEVPVESTVRNVKKAGFGLLAICAKMIGIVGKCSKLFLALASFAAYSWMFTYKFAFVLMAALAFHESGHVWAMKKWKLRTKGFYFVPFLGGAAISEERFPTRWAEVYIALMGPIWGLALATVTAMLYYATRSPFLAAIASWMAMINLFNLLPINPLDGGRIWKSICFSVHKKMGFFFLIVGAAAVIWATVKLGISGLFIFFMVVGTIEFLFEWRRMVKDQKLKDFAIRVLKGLELLEEGLSETARISQHAEPTWVSLTEAANAKIGIPQMKWQGVVWSAFLYVVVAAGLLAVMTCMKGVPGAALAWKVLEG